MKMHLLSSDERKKLIAEHNQNFQEWYNSQPKPIFDHAKERRSRKWKESK